MRQGARRQGAWRLEAGGKEAGGQESGVKGSYAIKVPICEPSTDILSLF